MRNILVAKLFHYCFYHICVFIVQLNLKYNDKRMYKFVSIRTVIIYSIEQSKRILGKTIEVNTSI